MRRTIPWPPSSRWRSRRHAQRHPRAVRAAMTAAVTRAPMTVQISPMRNCPDAMCHRVRLKSDPSITIRLSPRARAATRALACRGSPRAVTRRRAMNWSACTRARAAAERGSAPSVSRDREAASVGMLMIRAVLPTPGVTNSRSLSRALRFYKARLVENLSTRSPAKTQK